MLRMIHLPRIFVFFLGVGACLVTCRPGIAQNQRSDQEIIANLAAGRVDICVARDAILIGTESQNIEPGSHSPLVVPLDGGYVGILLGAVEWIEPGSGLPPVRLDDVLGHLATLAGHAGPVLEPGEAGDVESVGLAFLERLRPITGQLHHKIDLGPDEPLVELLLLDFHKDYGPEVWLLSYRVQQRELQEDYWDTLALRPSFVQLYPPEKHDPHTIIETRYPEGDRSPTLSQLLGENDPRLATVRAIDPKVAQAAQRILDGTSTKADPLSAITFIKGAMQATAPVGSRLSLAVLYADDKFDWVLGPSEPVPDVKREAGAPSLRHPHQ